MKKTLYDKLWAEHVVHTEEDGTAVLYIDRHLVHEVTSPQAFEGLREAGRPVWRVSSIVATADHNTPTTGWELGLDGITDPISREQVTTLDTNIRAVGAAAYFPFLSKRQGIVHVIGPEQGLTQPGMTIVCGDSHTSTHGAFGALAMGIERRTAAEFSFFLAIPTMLGASVLELWGSRHELASGAGPVGWGLIALGFFVAFVVALAVIKLFVAYVSRSGFAPFAWYRIAAGALAVFLLGR